MLYSMYGMCEWRHPRRLGSAWLCQLQHRSEKEGGERDRVQAENAVAKCQSQRP